LGTDWQFGTSCQTPKLWKWPYLLLIRTADWNSSFLADLLGERACDLQLKQIGILQ
jgi:hypothetical protein